jgi:hypothetical protein
MKANKHFWLYLSRFLLELKYFGQICRENENKLLCSEAFVRQSCRLWDNVEKYCAAGQATQDKKRRRMFFACCINKAADPPSECVIRFALWRQKSLRERASTLRDNYNACLVNNITKLCAIFTRMLVLTFQEVEFVISLLLKYVFCSVWNLQCSLFPSRKSNTYLLFRMNLVLWSWK